MTPTPARNVLIITSERPPVVSGIARSVDQIATGLRRLGHRVDVLAAVDFPRVIAGEVRLAAVLPHLAKVAPRLGDYDVVNVHGPVPTMSDVMLLTLRALPSAVRPAIVYTHHSNVDVDNFKRLSRVYNAAHESLANIADRVVVTSEAYREKFVGRDERRCAIVPWGVDITRFRAMRGAPLDDTGPLRITFIGQMRPYKGVDVLLDAVTGERQLHLVAIGGGPELERYRDRAATLDNVEFPGRVSDAELDARLAESDVVVLPSTTTAEAFGIVLIEGMAAGCVPVASDLPGVAEVARPTGVVVPPGDVAALREALTALAADRVRLASLRAMSIERSELFDVTRVGERYDAIMNEAIEHRDAGFFREVADGPLQPATVLAAVHRSVGCDGVAMLVLEGSWRQRLQRSWTSGPGVHAAAAAESPAAKHAATSGVTTIATTGERAERRTSQMFVPVSAAPGSQALLCLQRSAGTGDWTYRDIPQVFAALDQFDLAPV